MNTLVNEIVNSTTAIPKDVQLRRGCNSDHVKTLQTLLNYRGAELTVDGGFGAITEASVIEFQNCVRLDADGTVGPKTWNALRSGMAIARTPGSLINLRANPEKTAAIVQTLTSEETIVIQGRSPLMEDHYHWFQICARQTVGWVREDLIWLLPTFTFPLPIVNGITIQSRPRLWCTDINAKIEAAIRSMLSLGFLDRVRYFYRELDINGSGPQDVLLVYLFGDQVCGTGGCTLMLMRITEQGYRVFSRITSVQQPVIISNQKTNGYPDLIVYTAGGGISAAYRHLKFNGQIYPDNASIAPVLPTGSVVNGIALANRITHDLAAPLVSV